jgi:hypothetical protein
MDFKMIDVDLKLSPHFRLGEFLWQGTQMPQESKRFFTEAILNDKLDELKYLAEQMESVRELLGNKPIKVHCALRPYEWEIYRKRNGKSQHITGNAVDFSCPSYGTPLDIAKFLSKNKDRLKYDQLIFEHGWIHISFVKDRARKNDLTLDLKTMGYLPGIAG